MSGSASPKTISLLQKLRVDDGPCIYQHSMIMSIEKNLTTFLAYASEREKGAYRTFSSLQISFSSTSF